mmetsp:Transcript_7063/g.6260  ORF Transcript_7063/g.6260 Transcript_7063/m.6260 type:complete len:91 (-) Transcript_7063:230-502(-)
MSSQDYFSSTYPSFRPLLSRTLSTLHLDTINMSDCPSNSFEEHLNSNDLLAKILTSEIPEIKFSNCYFSITEGINLKSCQYTIERLSFIK